MFPTFISILDIQSWWEVPSIAHFCSLFRTAFNLLDFDIEDLEEALLTDGTEETSWLQDLIVRLLSGCLPNNEISTFNYQMFLRRLFRKKCQEHDRYNPFDTDCDFTLFPLRTKVDILHTLCDFRLDAEDVLDQLKNLEADSLRVEPLGYDSNDSAYWYFYGTRLYREDFEKKNNKKKAVWQVICFTEDDWFQLTKKFKNSDSKNERALYHTLNKNFLPELPRLFKEKERQARRRLLENQPRRTSDRIKKSEESNLSDQGSETRNEMASKKKPRSRQNRRLSSESSDNGSKSNAPKRKKTKTSEELQTAVKPSVGRQTNNSLSALDGQIVIQQSVAPVSSTKKKLKTSQVFQQSDEDLLVGMHKILDFVKNHEDAWPFSDPVEEEYAPNYYSIIRRPMDLTKMEEKLDQGLYKKFDKFKNDFQLIVNNCRLYNGAENEYTQMVDNLVKVFEKATERFLDQISSSDDEIAVENLNSGANSEEESAKKPIKKRKRSESPAQSEKVRGRKPTTSASQGRKDRDRSPSRASSKGSEQSKKKAKKSENTVKKSEKEKKKTASVSDKVLKKSTVEKSNDHNDKKNSKSKKESHTESKKEINIESKKENRTENKKDSKSSSKTAEKKPKKRGRKKKKFNLVQDDSSTSPSPSPTRSALGSPPPSSPDDSSKRVPFPWEMIDEPPPPDSPTDESKEPPLDSKHSSLGFPAFKPAKDKHNKLRETIEKLKAKSEISRVPPSPPVFDQYEVDDHLKENKDSKNKKKKHEHDSETLVDKKSTKKRIADRPVTSPKTCEPAPPKQSNYDALSLATEQTLKDINKWLDDTPAKFADFSSASNSPSYLAALDDFDLLAPGPKLIETKKSEKGVLPVSTMPKKDASVPKEHKKKSSSFRDPSKFFGKRREVQRTIDRLQPGKSKGNLISTVQNASKPEEMFPLGTLSKIKDTKNSLIVKTDNNAPKLSLGTVLDSFGKHKFVVDDQKKSEGDSETVLPKTELKAEDEPSKNVMKEVSVTQDEGCKKEVNEVKEEDKKEAKESKPVDENIGGGPTPNLSAWFKAFGAPKAPPPQKKADSKLELKEEEPSQSGSKSERVPPGDPSPSLESPQPVTRQRRISTGSSMSERSSFSQDLDSPRVGMEERGAYPAPYPSPLHKSPSSGASPVMASPRPDISPRSPYPFNGGQMRVGFYQDTVASSKSSPDKSCSPRENPPNSPYYQPTAGEHVYAPNTTQGGYSGSYTATSPYYTHAPPSYSSTNPTPPYNLDTGSNAYYDTSKITSGNPGDHYQAKPLPQSYTANSPASSQNSPAQPQMSPHSPVVHQSQMSPSVHSIHSPASSVVDPFHPQMTDVDSAPSDQIKDVQSPQQQPVFPVKKRAFLDTDLSSQFAVFQDDITVRNHQQQKVQEEKQQQQQHLQSMQTVHEQMLQQMQQQQQHHQQQQVVRAPALSPGQAQQAQANVAQPQQQPQSLPDRGSVYPTSAPAPQYDINYGARDSYTLRSLPTSHPQKLDMSKFTNMGYSGPEVNFSRALQQQYSRPDLNYVRTTVQSAISQASQLLSSQSLNASQPSVSATSALSNYPKSLPTNQHQAHAPPYHHHQSGRAVDSVAERLAQVQQEPSRSTASSGYSSSPLDLEQALGLGRNLSNIYSNDQRMMAGLQPASNPYYNDKSLGMFNKQMFSQSNLMGYGQQPPQQQQQTQPQQQQQQQQQQPQQSSQQAPQSMIYSRQMELQPTHDLKAATVTSNNQPQERKQRKKKSASSKGQEQQAPAHGFQSYAGLKGAPAPAPANPLDPIALKTSSVPGSAFNFGSGALGMGAGLSEGYPNLLDDFRGTSNHAYFMGGANPKPPGQAAGQGYPPFLNPAAHQGRGAAYPLGGPFMDTSSQLYQHYLQAGVLNQGLLGATAPGYPPGYHPLTMRQPYDSMSRPSWL